MRIAVCALSLIAASSASAAHPGARPGEAFTFKFSLGPVEGGRARMSIGHPVSERGRRVIAVHGEAETTAFVSLLARMKDDYKLVFDTATLLPLSVSETERGVRQRRIVTRMNGRTAEVDYWAPDKRLRGRRILPRIGRDPLSGLFALRAMPLGEGQRIELDVLDGNALWRVDAVAHRGARVRLEGDAPGSPVHAAIRVDGVARRIDDAGRPRPRYAARHLTLWLSDDAFRVLLRMEADTDFGRCALELTSYIPPRVASGDERPPLLPGIVTR